MRKRKVQKLLEILFIEAWKLKKIGKHSLKKFKVIKAAGGVVQNSQNKYLLIFRRGKWDLPKGKIDKGETIKNAATREVMEETGLHEIELRQTYLPNISYLQI